MAALTLEAIRAARQTTADLSLASCRAVCSPSPVFPGQSHQPYNAWRSRGSTRTASHEDHLPEEVWEFSVGAELLAAEHFRCL